MASNEEALVSFSGKGKQRLVRGEGERGPILDKLLSGSGGQPKGKILVLESQRGEEG